MTENCPAALNIKGEHFSCDTPIDEYTGKVHAGWVHGNKEAGAIWCGSDAPIPLPGQRGDMEYNYTISDDPKMLRETLCVAQTWVGLYGDSRKKEHMDRLQRLIAECDRKRPLGKDGKHGNLHTPECGCQW